MIGDGGTGRRRRRFVILGALGALFVPAALVAALNYDGWVTFSSGTPAKSADVNKNFSLLRTAADQLDRVGADAFYAALSAYCQAWGGTTQTHMVAVVGKDGNESLTGTSVCQTFATDVIGPGYAFANGYMSQCVQGAYFYSSTTRGTLLRAAPVLYGFTTCDKSPGGFTGGGYKWAAPGQDGIFFCCN
jgi:hypothetical protein